MDELNEIRQENAEYRKEIKTLRQKLLLAEDELQLYKNSISYKIGNLFVMVFENPLKIFRFPYDLFIVIRSGLKSYAIPKKRKIKKLKQNLISENKSKNTHKKLTTVDIIVCVHNALEDVKECLTSLYRTRSIPFNLIIVDDGSNLSTEKFLNNFSVQNNCKLFRNKEALGYTIAANIGLKNSKNDYVVLLNSDTIVTDGWLEKLIKCMEIDSNTGIVGPLSNAASWQTVPEVMEDGDWKVNVLSDDINLELMSQIVEAASVKEYPLVPFVNGFCFMISRRVINTIGYLDEETFPKGYGEENDYCIRALNVNFNLRIADDTYIYHEKSKSFSHEVRKELSPKASVLLRTKHGNETIKKLIMQIKSDKIFSMIRKRIIDYLKLFHDIDNLKAKKIAFVLTARGGGGGANSVVQETKGLIKLGLMVKIINTRGNMLAFSGFYPDCLDYTIFAKSKTDIPGILKDFDIGIATVYHTVELVNEALYLNNKLIPAYYIQDYETLFFTEGSKEYQKAYDSYNLIKNNNYFAKTQWLINTVNRTHHKDILKIKPSIDTLVYNPYIKIALAEKTKLKICAMIRPNTPRRSPYETIKLMQVLKKIYKEKIDLKLFGCSNEDLNKMDIKLDFKFTNYSQIPSHKVRELLLQADIFIDYSTYQAFGRTGIEAMSSGCVAVLPKNCGTEEYAIDGYNAVLIDTDKFEENLPKVKKIIDDFYYRQTLIARGIETAKKYNIRTACFSQLLLFKNMLGKNKHSFTIGYKYSEKLNQCPTGTSYLRLFIPLMELLKNNSNLQAIRVTDDTLFNLNIDVLLTHRNAISLEQVRRLQKLGVKIVYDIDDNIIYQNPILKQIIKEVSIVTVSNEYLKQIIKNYNQNIKVIPNYLDKEMWFGFNREIFNFDKKNKNKQFVFIGTPTHRNNLALIKEDIKVFSKQYHYDFVTNFPTDMSKLLFIPIDNYPNYIKHILRVVHEVDFGIAILELNDFNFGKSYLKYLEYTAMGIPAVYTVSERIDFKNVIVDNVNGLTVLDNLNWKDKLIKITDKKLRERIIKNARSDIEKNYTITKGVKKWEEVLK